MLAGVVEAARSARWACSNDREARLGFAVRYLRKVTAERPRLTLALKIVRRVLRFFVITIQAKHVVPVMAYVDRAAASCSPRLASCPGRLCVCISAYFLIRQGGLK